jgi:hypothetical protein
VYTKTVEFIKVYYFLCVKVKENKKIGWSWVCFMFGPFWYLYKGFVRKGSILLGLVLITFGFGLPVVCLYCGMRGKRDLYEKELKQHSAYKLNDIDK